MITVETPDSSALEEIRKWPVWEKEPCSFDEDYTAREQFYILEGSARLSVDGEPACPISPGDLVTVEKGVLVRWQISTPLKKHFKFF